MRYLKKERVEIQEVYLMYISYIEKHLVSGTNFLCNMDRDLCKYNDKGYKAKCGLNDRILPNALVYLHGEMPTKVKNKVIFELPLFRNNDEVLTVDVPWWNYDGNPDSNTVNIAINREKIIFLQHLIKKLR